MLQDSYSFEELKFSSQLVRDLIAKDKKIEPLINQFYSIENIQAQIAQKNFTSEKRNVLVDALRSQNEGIKLTDATKENFEALLNENTFTITTGHQLNLMSGPLYSIYKVAQVVLITDELNKKHPNNRFVPVFWMATEDHDFEEINHLHLFGQKLSWEKTDQENKIAGRINTDSIQELIEQIEGKFQDPTALTLVQQFTDNYKSTSNLADATRNLMNALFGKLGVVIIDGDDANLKSLFKDVMIKEVQEEIGYSSVMKTNTYLEDKGYHQQVFVRESNLFYINEDGIRQRISKVNGQFEFGGKEKAADELIAEIESNPERFSPNALYRPIYQETILPNLVYVGGGGEMAYWLQLKELFAAHNVTFPMIRTRDSILLYNNGQAEMLETLNLELMDLKLGVDQIVKDIAINESESNLQLTDAESGLMSVKSQVMEKVNKVNPNLQTMVDAEFSKMVKTIERIESKLIKAEKSKHEQTQKKLIKIREQFFPENGFQERYENFLPYYLKDDNFVHKIVSTLSTEDEARVRLLEI